MTTTVKIGNSLWKGIAVILLLIISGLGIWAYQTSRQVTFGWEPMPAGQSWASVRIYDLSIIPPALVAETQCTIGPPVTCPTEVTTIMPRAAHTYVARAWDGFWESGDSNSVGVPAPPDAPTGLKKR